MALLTWLWTIIKSALNTLAKLFVMAVVVVLLLVAVGLMAGDGLSRNMVLALDLRHSLSDKSAPTLFDLTTTEVSLMDIVLGLDAAARDSRVKGVFLRVGSGDLSVPQAQELRASLKRFKAAGKFVIAHSQSFYSGGLGDYQVAAAADQIWMQPASAFFSAGPATTSLFLRGLFDKIGAVPQIVQREEYKNAANMFMETDFTPAHLEATTRLLESWYETAIDEIAADRRLERDALVATLEESPSSADFVKEKGLITAIGYDDDASDAALERAGEDAKLTAFKQYVDNHDIRPQSGGPVLALVHAAGEIVEGDDDTSLAGTSIAVAGDSFAQAIREATEDDSVRAILVRVDSPGGSAIASDQILDALKKARAEGKPVVVSMGSVAASGGYYIALAADRIVAQPGTITGSIGVLWGKVAFGNALERIGVNARDIGEGRNSTFLSSVAPWDEDQMEEVEAQADLVYDDFTRKVAEGRKMPLERVRELARGRVWTGSDAQERGLVDELGGFWVAVDNAKRLAEIDPETRVVFHDFPRREGLVDRVSSFFDVSSASFAAVRGLHTLASTPAVRALIAVADDMPRGQVEMRATGLPLQ
jgi:protease-4